MESTEISNIKKDMIREAYKKYKEIHLPSPSIYKKFEDCFTFEKDKIILWFNTSDLSTKAIQRKIPS